MNKFNLQKFETLKNDVIFIDGTWGSGKSIIAPIVGGMDRVEKQMQDTTVEYFCILYKLGKIDFYAAKTMIHMWSDVRHYHNFIGREVNLRLFDNSGPIKNPGGLKYFLRLFGGEGNTYIEKINIKNIALLNMSHNLLITGDFIFNVFGDRFKLIEVIRHPLYLINHWSAYLNRWDMTREGTLSLNYNNNKIPWFAYGWESAYDSMSQLEKIVKSIINIYENIISFYKSKNNVLSNNVIFLSFESLVLEPQKDLEKISRFLNRKHSKNINKLMRKQRIPRSTLLKGVGWSSYGYKKEYEMISDKSYYKIVLKNIKKDLSPNIYSKLFDIIKTYNKVFPSFLLDYEKYH